MPFRSLLFTPATRLDRLDRALASGADWVALDLEDGVGPTDKDTARRALIELAASKLAGLSDRVAIRINAPATAEGIRDLAAMLDWAAWPGLLILPKIEAAAQVEQMVALTACRSPAPAFLVTLETATGIANAAAIARAIPDSAVLGYGSADHMAETGGTMSEASLSYGRAQVINAAAIAGIPAVDGVWLDYRDADGLVTEAELARSMGFAGKIAIHPDQIGAINTVFSPTQDEIVEARALLAASEAAGGGVFAHDGKMIDAPVLARAKRIANLKEWKK